MSKWVESGFDPRGSRAPLKLEVGLLHQMSFTICIHLDRIIGKSMPIWNYKPLLIEYEQKTKANSGTISTLNIVSELNCIALASSLVLTAHSATRDTWTLIVDQTSHSIILCIFFLPGLTKTLNADTAYPSNLQWLPWAKHLS